MGLDFIRHHLDFDYTPTEYSRIRDWYQQSADCCKFFEALASTFSQTSEIGKVVLNKTEELGVALSEMKSAVSVVKKKKKRDAPWKGSVQ